MQGSSGEAVLLSAEERVKLLNEVRKLVPSTKLLLAGTGCESKFGISVSVY